jgi:ketosteroid isomerase-like protein
LQLDRSNQAAATKLNMIKDLFSQTTVASRPPATKVAAADVKATPAPAAKAVEPPKAAEKAPEKAPPAKAAEKAPEKAPEKAAEKAAPRSNDDVIRSVNAWARAWASNDVPGYLSFYAPDFQTPGGMSRSAWENERKQRIAKPRKIEVDVQNPAVKFDDKSRAIVTFRQQYKSPPLNVTSTKTLVMVKSGDKWLIQQERSGS